jgi:hypothetical protein
LSWMCRNCSCLSSSCLPAAFRHWHFDPDGDEHQPRDATEPLLPFAEAEQVLHVHGRNELEEKVIPKWLIYLKMVCPAGLHHLSCGRITSVFGHVVPHMSQSLSACGGPPKGCPCSSPHTLLHPCMLYARRCAASPRWKQQCLLHSNYMLTWCCCAAVVGPHAVHDLASGASPASLSSALACLAPATPTCRSPPVTRDCHCHECASVPARCPSASLPCELASLSHSQPPAAAS